MANRLKWFAEKRNLISSVQCGFRSKRRTTDQLLRLHDTIFKALANKRSILAVFLDVEKAYDTVYTPALLLKLYKASINGRMFNFIQQFVANRSFQVRVNSTLSKKNKKSILEFHKVVY